jgi:hypothetical protein
VLDDREALHPVTAADAVGVQRERHLRAEQTTRAAQDEGESGREAVSLSLKRVVLAATGVWLATRVAYVIYTYVVLAFGNTATPRAQTFLESWNQFDTRWFLLISQVGYSIPVTSAFFPLYPTLIGLVTAALGDAQGPVSPAFDGIRLLVAFGIANAATLLAFIGLALLAAHEYREEAVARAAVWVLASYPFAFFLAAPYSDGPFLAAAVFVLYFARRGSWKWAALAALLAGLTRPTAVTLVLPLAWEFGRQHGWWSKAVLRDWRGHLKDLPEGLLVVAAAPLALALYGVFLWQRFGTPLVWFNVQGSFWHRAAIPLWRIAGGLVRRMLTFQPLGAAEAHLLLNVVPLAICLIVVAVSIRRIPFAFTLFVLGLCYISVSAPVFSTPELIESTSRFLLAAAPVFLVIGRWTARRPALGHLWAASGLMVQGGMLTFFFAGRWIA